MTLPGDAITAVDVWPADVPLTDRFVISRGALTVAEVAFVRVRVAGGAEGFGEIAPFEALTGETRDASAEAARRLGASIIGERTSAWPGLGERLAARAPREPAARAGIECAAVDALSRLRGEPLYRFLGGADVRPRETDITIPILDEARIDALASRWYERGFRVFKLKVGGDVDADVRRLERLAGRFAGVSFILDANQGYERAQAREFLRGMRAIPGRVRLFEQPLPRDDLEGMAALRAERVAPIAADESVFTRADAERVIAAGAADCVNLKIMKSGLAETVAIATRVRAAGLELMIGGMMETRLAMSFSYAVVLGIGGIEHLDLDTPLLLAEDPVEGGYAYRGPTLAPWAGSGVEARPRTQPFP
jgi:L-alanine-DL-glutamate epimerase-like enolase superfamily enzyme